MIDLVQLRREPDALKAALGRRGVSLAAMDSVLALDVEHRALLQESERLRAEVKFLSRLVGEARREKDLETADQLAEKSRRVGDEERSASVATERVGALLREQLLALPNVPAPFVPDGLDENDNVELRQWWVGKDEGLEFPNYAEYQRVPHWDIGTELGILDLEAGAKLAGSMFPLYRGDGSRLLRALGAFALDRHRDAYEEIRPPVSHSPKRWSPRATCQNRPMICTPSNATDYGQFLRPKCR
jgi:seryl-tRNA synthetase